jgi:S1-C subfamily serine protease
MLITASIAHSQVMDSKKLFQKASPAIVEVTTTKGEVSSQGTGVLISSDGTILSALHVLEGGSRVVVKLRSGDVFDNVVITAYDERRDLVVLKVPGFDLPTIPLGNSNLVAEGEPVAVISNPAGLHRSITTGVVSGIRELENTGFEVIQTSAAASPGSSGGAMLNGKGELIAIISFKVVGGENLNFGIPVNYARGLIPGHESLSVSQLSASVLSEN